MLLAKDRYVGYPYFRDCLHLATEQAETKTAKCEILRYVRVGLVSNLLRYFLEESVRSELDRRSQITTDPEQRKVPWNNSVRTQISVGRTTKVISAGNTELLVRISYSMFSPVFISGTSYIVDRSHSIVAYNEEYFKKNYLNSKRKIFG